ncbi:hypothetical protein [Segniliparus rugosus]|nr:hypothetical protein [Segniliparus rugosus]
MSRSAKAVPAFAAALAVALSGCSDKQQSAPSSGKAAPSASTAVALPPAEVVTPKDADKKEPLRPKFGQPITYQRDGVSITVAPRGWEKTKETPQGLVGNLLDCGLWWRVAQTWIVDAKPDTDWRSWRRDFQGVFGLFGEAKDAKYGFYSEVALSAVSDAPDDLDKALGKAVRDWDHKAPLHFEQTGAQYLASCKVNTGPEASQGAEQFIPDTRPLFGVELTLPSVVGQNPRTWPTVAIWTP